MYHSLIFIEKKYWNNWLLNKKARSVNTWDAWKIVPSSRPVFNPPKQKTQYLDIPGADGALDVSEALTHYPIFENREGSIEFLVTNDYQKYRWHLVYEEISNFLHGQQMRAILEDDPGYFYEGRFQVDEWSSEKDFSKITIDYTVKPYKYELISSIDDWLWDPFNFEKDKIMSALYKNFSVNTTSGWVTKKLTYDDSGLAPFCPEFRVTLSGSSSMKIKYTNPNAEKGLTVEIKKSGTSFQPEMMVFGGDVTFAFQGQGTVSIVFRRGRL